MLEYAGDRATRRSARSACAGVCGMFHGDGGAEARDAFAEAFGEKLNADPEQKPLAGLDRLRGALERRAEDLGSLHVREPYHRWTFTEGEGNAHP